jgi:thiol-disulfide isomerase/thioredoxin
MALTPSNMIALDTIAPEFTLKDVISGKQLSLSEMKSPVATLIMFICNHCPYVKHIQHELAQLAKDYQPKKIAFIAINSNDIETYPDDSPEKMKETAERLNYTFPYLFDETQEVAKAYRAACTPDFYLFDKRLNCIYRGQFDDSRPGNNIPVSGKNIREALDAALSGKPVKTEQKPSIGCNIKWKEKYSG